MTLSKSPLKLAALIFLGLLTLTACTQETQNKISRGIQNWTGTNGVLDIYAGGEVAMRFIKIDKLSTAKGTQDGGTRPYRYGYGYVDQNRNFIVDDNENKKVYFEISDYATPYVFYESYR
ncbi:MAG: hypothetical protein ACPG4N_06880 [Gammaproteobacteria bacterium]